MNSPGQYSFTLLPWAFMHNIHILVSSEKLVPKHKDWVTLSAGSGFMLFFFFFLFLIAGFYGFDSTKLSKSTQKTFTHTQRLLFHTSKCEALQGLSTLASMASPFFFLSRQPESVLTALLLIFIFPLNFNYSVLHPSCRPIVGMLITTCSFVAFTMWLSDIDFFFFLQHIAPFCYPFTNSMLLSLN